MGMPAARVGDMHTCPMFDGPKPHVGGPVLPPGQPNVFIEGLPAARVGDPCLCVGPPDAIAVGSPTVFIGRKMAARMNDMTVHGGMIVLGATRTFIGNGTPTGDRPDCMKTAAENGSGMVS
ncbi:MAG: PAAR domain-containing protein [Isosphaeraceae bacterium]